MKKIRNAFFYIFLVLHSNFWTYISGIYIAVSVNIFTNIIAQDKIILNNNVILQNFAVLRNEATWQNEQIIDYKLILVAISVLVISALCIFVSIVVSQAQKFHDNNKKTIGKEDDIKKRWYDVLKAHNYLWKLICLSSTITVLHIFIIVLCVFV